MRGGNREVLVYEKSPCLPVYPLRQRCCVTFEREKRLSGAECAEAGLSLRARARQAAEQEADVHEPVEVVITLRHRMAASSPQETNRFFAARACGTKIAATASFSAPLRGVNTSRSCISQQIWNHEFTGLDQADLCKSGYCSRRKP